MCRNITLMNRYNTCWICHKYYFGEPSQHLLAVPSYYFGEPLQHLLDVPSYYFDEPLQHLLDVP